MKRIKWTLLRSAAMFFSLIPPVFALTLNKHIEVSVAGGANWFHSNNSTMVISADEIDGVLVTRVANAPIWKVGAGYSAFESALSNRSFLNNLLVELNFYHSSSTLRGNVWQYQFSEFNNYRFRVPVVSNRLMLDLKPRLFTYRQVSPFVILGGGIAWNTASYRDVATGEGVDPASYLSIEKSTSRNAAYDLGLGVQTDLSKSLSLSLEYLFSHLGHVSTANASKNGASLVSGPRFALQSQSALLELSWKI